MKKIKNTKSELVQWRVTPGEKRQLEKNAALWGLNISDYLRMVALETMPDFSKE